MSLDKKPLRPIRQAFLERLESSLYVYLRTLSLFKIWGTTDLYALAKGIIEINQDEINKVLDKSNFSVKDTDKAIETILESVLKPSIERIKI